jgi:hypothetical protein
MIDMQEEGRKIGGTLESRKIMPSRKEIILLTIML